MTAGQVQTIVCAVLGLAGLAAIVFAFMRGRRVGGSLAFGLGGLGLVIYAGVYTLTERVARMADLIRAGEQARGGGVNPATAQAKQILAAVDPNAALEPVALLLLAFGFAALARASDARGAAEMPTAEGGDA